MRNLILIYCYVIISICKEKAFSQFKPNWDSLDSRPLPPWYDDAKIGIFLHWGVFSVPSYSSAWFWKYLHDKKPEIVNFMKTNYRPGFTYQDFAPMFTAEFYDPKEWADIFNASGARYIVLTSKHHEGFTLWPSNYSWNWNAMDVGPKRDLLGDLANAIRESHPHIHFGLYHSLFEFFNPLYLRDKGNKFSTKDFVTRKTMPELYELVNNYKPDVIWSDGDWEAKDTYWNSTNFLAWLFNNSPVRKTVVVNDRWGAGTACKHGSFYNCHDKYNPKSVQLHKWENCMTLDKHAWTFRRNAKAEDFLTIEELLQTLVETISCGGNLLVNTGPTHDGKIAPIMEERLRQMGEWLAINGEAIYGSKPWVHQNDTYTKTVWYTQSKDKGSIVYAFVLKWPDQNSLILGNVKSTWLTRIYVLGNDKSLPIKEISKGLEISLPDMNSVKNKWVWVFKLQRIKPRNAT